MYVKLYNEDDWSIENSELVDDFGDEIITLVVFVFVFFCY